MKSTYKLLSLAMLAATMASCADDLNTEFLGGAATTEQKEEVLSMEPERALASVTGAYAAAYLYGKVYDAHFDFGYPCLMLGMDLQTEDVLCKQTGYNWHTYWEGYTSPNQDGTPTTMMWYTIYKQILTCNNLIATIDPETEIDQLQFYLANGLALRAWDYFNLVQVYQFNYTIDPEAPGVPLITPENSEEAASEGCARAPLTECYALIESDLNLAVELLQKSGKKPSDMISSKPKRMISLPVAYGLLARVALVKHEYAKAAEYADKAIQSFSGSPYSMQEVSVPTFSDIDDSAWMWGIATAESDRVVTTGLCNWPSFMVTFADGYVGVGAWKYCGYKLWNSIPATDVRKGWFLDDNYTSPNITAEQQAYINDFIDEPIYETQDNSACIFPQTNVKFNTYKGVLLQSVNANDIPLMRIEEMYLIKAEGQAMSGNVSAGQQTLVDFVTTYRNPSYQSKATTAEQVQNEVWLQRRIELWGEGLAFFDVMRLNKGIDRRNDRCPLSYQYVIEPEDPVLLYCIPRGEITANKKISASEANTESTRPVPVLE